MALFKNDVLEVRIFQGEEANKCFQNVRMHSQVLKRLLLLTVSAWLINKVFWRHFLNKHLLKNRPFVHRILLFKSIYVFGLEFLVS